MMKQTIDKFHIRLSGHTVACNVHSVFVRSYLRNFHNSYVQRVADRWVDHMENLAVE